MSHLYLTESDIKLGYNQGQVVASWSDGRERRIPFENVDGISVFGMAQISTALVRQCISNDVAIGYYSEDGHYFGATRSLNGIDPARQKRQMLLTDDEAFCLEWSRIIVDAKLRNSLALLESMRDVYDFAEDDIYGLHHSLKALHSAESVDMVMGFEGNAAKCYFACLPKVLRNEEFAFNGRTTRPPKDPFNSMISYGYSLLYRNITGAIERHGLHPYFAYMHKLKHGHAALASDLIEEFRAPLVDKTVIDFINDGEADLSDFDVNESGAVYMKKPIMKKLTDKLSDIVAMNHRYFLAYGDRKSYGFQVMLDKKIESLLSAIEYGDPRLYKPFIWDYSG